MDKLRQDLSLVRFQIDLLKIHMRKLSASQCLTRTEWEIYTQNLSGLVGEYDRVYDLITNTPEV